MRILSCLVVTAAVVAVSACDKSNPASPAAESSVAPAAVHATIQMKGVVETIGKGSFTIGGQTVITNANTRFSLNGTATGPSALSTGRHVAVEGTASIGGSVLASSVEIENENEVEHPVPEPQPEPEVKEIEISGLVLNFSGSPASFQFQLGGTLVTGNGSTVFDKNVFADLKNGATVEVKGNQQTASVLATRIHVEEANEPAPPAPQPAQEIEFTGPLTSKSGAAPVFTLVVGGRTVHTSASTLFRRHGDPIDPSVLQTGMSVEVEGAQRPDASVDAEKITIEEEDEALEVQLQGTISGLTGACPALQFTINGALVVTSSSTDFRTSCSALQNTLNVEVRGLKQPNGTVNATRVEKK